MLVRETITGPINKEEHNMAGTKKEIKIYHEWNESLYRMKFIGGGQLPEILGGLWTSVKAAEQMRDLYYAGKLPKRPQSIQAASELAVEKQK